MQCCSGLAGRSLIGGMVPSILLFPSDRPLPSDPQEFLTEIQSTRVADFNALSRILVDKSYSLVRGGRGGGRAGGEEYRDPI